MLLMITAGLLMAGTPEPAPAVVAVAEKPENKKVCRRQVETGSLVKARKVCKTLAQWREASDNSREELERSASMGSRSGQ